MTGVIVVIVLVVLAVLAVLVLGRGRGTAGARVESESGSGQAPAAGEPLYGPGLRDVGPSGVLTPGLSPEPTEPLDPSRPDAQPAPDPLRDPAASETDVREATAGQDAVAHRDVPPRPQDRAPAPRDRD